jgi:endonuclease IV
MLGIHVAKTSKVLDPPGRERKTMTDAIEIDTSALGLNAAQIFTYGPRGYRRVIINYDNVRDYCRNAGIILFIHSSYPSIKIWSVDRKNKTSKESKKIIKHIKDQLEACQKMGAAGFVLHVVAEHPEKVLETLKIIEPIISRTKVRVLLENPYMRPSELTFETPEKLNNLCSVLSNSSLKKRSWGLCMDTAHLWASCVDISSKQNMNEWLHDFRYKKKIGLVHLNGNARPMCRKDQHAIAFFKDDRIWRSYLKTRNIKGSGAYILIKFCKVNRVPIICEINMGTQHDAEQSLEIIRNILGKKR